MYPKLNSYTLDNNFRVLLIPLKKTQHIACSLCFDMGFTNELKKDQGLCHYAEHLLARYITNETEIFKIKGEGKFVYNNASANDFKTSYYMYSNKKNLKIIIESLLKIFNADITNTKTIEKEKKAVEIEIKQIMSNLEKYVHHKHIPEMMFGKDNSLVRNIPLQIKNLPNFDKKTVNKYIKENYLLNNSVLTVCGNFDNDAILRFIKKNVKLINKDFILKHDHPFNRKIIIPSNTHPKIKCVNSTKKINTVHFNFFVCKTEDYKTKGVLYLLKTIMTGLNDLSIFFKELRIKLGLTYSTIIKLSFNKYFGYMTLKYAIDSKDFKKVYEKTLNILKNIKKYINEPLLKLGKSKMLYSLNSELDDTNPESYLKYSEMILNEQSLITPQKFYNEYVKDVTIDDINNVCKKYFVKENFYICILGKNFPKINYMEKQLDNM